LNLRATRNGRTVELAITREMIERVLAEWEQEHPGGNPMLDMGEDEFARRMMIEVRASARLLP
jgi:hypothetical protein